MRNNIKHNFFRHEIREECGTAKPLKRILTSQLSAVQVGWFVGLLVGWLVGLSVGWLVGCVSHILIDWLVNI